MIIERNETVLSFSNCGQLFEKMRCEEDSGRVKSLFAGMLNATSLELGTWELKNTIGRR